MKDEGGEGRQLALVHWQISAGLGLESEAEASETGPCMCSRPRATVNRRALLEGTAGIMWLGED